MKLSWSKVTFHWQSPLIQIKYLHNFFWHILVFWSVMETILTNAKKLKCYFGPKSLQCGTCILSALDKMSVSKILSYWHGTSSKSNFASLRNKISPKCHFFYIWPRNLSSSHQCQFLTFHPFQKDTAITYFRCFPFWRFN